jgi:phosphatidylserine decarboxylase
MKLLLIFVSLLIVLFIFWRFYFFLRNPNRKIEANENIIYSPADGKIVYVKFVDDIKKPVFSIKNEREIRLDELMFLGESDERFTSGWLIGIAMGPLDVHYNRAPVGGHIRKLGHDFPTGMRRNFNMFPALQDLFFRAEEPWRDAEYLIYNERASYVIENGVRPVFVTQIADRYVRKILTFKDNCEIAQGAVFGMIRMGSQVDLFIPASGGEVRIGVQAGQKVKAGKSSCAWQIF